MSEQLKKQSVSLSSEVNAMRVSPCDMEGLSAAMFVAGHTGSSGCFTLSPLVLTDITCLYTQTYS